MTAAWDLSCPDWIERLKSGRSLLPDLPIYTAEGERAVSIFKKLRLHDVPGTPTMAEACGDWFLDLVRVFFGSFNRATRRRMIRELLLLVPKKNSKTTNGALLMLTALLINVRPDATFILTAPVQDVAEKAYEAVVGSIELDEVLKKLFHTRDHKKTVVHRQTGASLEIMTFDPKVLTGQKVSGGALIDELHVVASMAKADRAIRQLRGGMLPFEEAFLAFITTQSEDAPSGVFAAELTKARDIRDGKRKGVMLPVLFEFPSDMQKDMEQWTDPENWSMVTPNLGRSISLDRLEEEFETAKDTSEAELRAWASQHLNVQIGLALMSNRWAGADFWEAQADASITLDSMLERCDVITVGIDGGGNDDLYGFTALGKDAETGDLLAWSRAYALPIVLERRKDISERLLDFAKDGDLVIVPRIEDAAEQVVALIQRIDEAGKLGALDDGKRKAIGVDAACIKQTLDALNAAGYPDDVICSVSQGWRLGSSIKSTELYLSSGTLSHADQPLTDWCVSNAKVEARANSILITKQASGSAKIDPLMSLFNAVELMGRNPQGGEVSVYEELARAAAQREAVAA